MADSKEMDILIEKLKPIIYTEKVDNLIDLLSVISDNIEMTNDAMVEKLIKQIDAISTAGFIMDNATRYAKKEISKETETPSIFAIMKELNDPEVKRGLQFSLKLLKGLGKQI